MRHEGALLLLLVQQHERMSSSFLQKAPLIRRGGIRDSNLASSQLKLKNGEIFYNDFEGFNDDQEDNDYNYCGTESLGDWRKFRMNLARAESLSPKEDVRSSSRKKYVSTENEAILIGQSEILAEEYISGIWAHEVSQPEAGGLIIRMPLEVEIYRSSRDSSAGEKLRSSMQEGEKVERWYRKAQILCEKEIQKITTHAENGQIDASKLSEVSNEFLQMYLDNQETWQEVCLVMNRNSLGGTVSTLVLNRPMAFKLTENLGLLILQGAGANKFSIATNSSSVEQLMEAFGEECAVYVGGPDAQGEPATLLHGFKDIPGAIELSPGSNIYTGGIDHAIQGVLDGKYKPLDFRFFIGKHEFTNRHLDALCTLGKYQPIACARPIVLKQCISLPTPLYHEVMELCGGELGRISHLEQTKRNDDVYVEFAVDDEDTDKLYGELGSRNILDDEEEEADDFII